MHSTYLFSAIALAGTSVLAQLRPAHKFVEIQDSLKDTCDEWEKACSNFDQDAGPVDSTCDTVVDIHQNGDCDNQAAVTCFRPVDEPSKPESLAQDVADNLHWDLNDACPSANPSATTTIS